MHKATYHCPIGATLSIIGGKWKPLILWEIREEPRRFTSIKRAIEGVSQKMLTQQLRELEADGVITRQVYTEMPLHVEYYLTPHGQSLFPILEAMAKWGYEHYADQFSPPLSSL